MNILSTSRSVRVLLSMFLLASINARLRSELIPVRHRQGSMHGFLVLKTSTGTILATGDVTGVVHGAQLTSRLTFRFHDGSIDDDTTVFTQDGVFRLISDHHIQHGPSFPNPVDVLIDAETGQITSRTEDGKFTQEHLDLPADVANGLPPNLLLNFLPTTRETRISFVAPTTKPRLISISVRPAGEVPFTLGGTRRKAMDFVLHVELGGLTGLIAPIIGKQPADYHIWILEGTVPAFIREEGQFYVGGPVWTVEQLSPTFPH